VTEELLKPASVSQTIAEIAILQKVFQTKSPGLWEAEALPLTLRGCIPGQRERQ
jgi:hypothetical protein